jgi:hypothetical protein
MDTSDQIRYPGLFKKEYARIRKSQLVALHKMVDEGYLRSTGLSRSGPHEIWQFIIGRAEHMASTKEYKRFRARLGKPTLRLTVLRLAKRVKDDGFLAKHLLTLLKVFRGGRSTRTDYESNRRDADKITRLVLGSWIHEPSDPRLLVGSFCFYSDLALGKVAYRLAHKRLLSAELLEKERNRIRKVCDGLGLIRAKHRVVKDVQWNGQKFELILFKKATKVIPRRK